MRMRIGWLVILLVIMRVAAAAQEDVVMKAMRDEMARSMKELSLPDSPKPYFIAYRVAMLEVNPIGATLGSLLALEPQRSDLISAEVRVGDATLDNTNFLATQIFSMGPAGFFHGMRTGPLQGEYLAIRRELWRATDDEYKRAVEDYAAKRAALEGRGISEPLPDFSSEAPTHWSGSRHAAEDSAAGEQLARELSAAFRKYPEIHESSVHIELRSVYTRYLNSEGTWFTRGDSEVKLEIKADTQAPDGMPLGDSYHIFAASLADLPPKAQLLACVDALGVRLRQLRSAKPLERYSGPVLFEGDAAAEAFSKAFAPALVAVRQPLSDNAQVEVAFERILGQGGSLKDRIGGRVLPASLTVVNDPLRIELNGVRLPVSAQIDDEGVPTRKMTLIENGILKALLSTRVPVPGNSKSSGSRRTIGAAPTTLLVSVSHGMSAADLRRELLRKAKERGSDYAIVIRRAGRGKLAESFMDMVTRMQGQGRASDSLLETYKLYSDGREELVRGAQIEGLTVADFKEIAAVGDKPVLYSDEFIPRLGASFFSEIGMAAASGVPVVNYSVPSLLFEDLSVTPVSGPYPALPLSPPPLMQTASK